MIPIFELIRSLLMPKLPGARPEVYCITPCSL